MYKLTQDTKELYKKKVAAIKLLAAVVEKLAHTAGPNKRIATAFKKAHPEYTISYGTDYGLFRIRLWGNGLDYQDGLYLCWSGSKNTWEELKAQIQISDFSDYLERLEAEEKLYPQLAVLEEQIGKLKLKAQTLVESLGVPKSATARASECHWDSASSETTKEFPGALAQPRV